MDDLEFLETKRKVIYDYLSKTPTKMITFHDADKLFPGCRYIFTLMVIDQILEIKEVDDELVYMIAGSELLGLES